MREIQTAKYKAIGIAKRRKRRFVPISLRFAFALIKNRNLISNMIFIHRIDYAFLLRILKKNAYITLFIHTDTSAMLSKSSDSIWRFIPRIYNFFEKVSLNAPNRVFVYSLSDLSRLKSKRSDISLATSFYNDLIFFESVPWNLRAKTVLWVGRFENPKDPIFAMKVVKAFKLAGRNDVYFKFIGDGSLESKMAEIMVDEGLDNMQILPALSNIELAIEMNSAKVLFSTSHFEGSPRILYEAAGCKMSLVTCTSADPEEVASKFGYGIRLNSRSVGLYFREISRLIDLQIRIECATSGRQGTEVVNIEF